MAEARLAVAFQFAVTDEGVVVNVDKEVVKLVARSAYKSVKRRCKYAKNTILKGVYPASPATWMFVLAAVLAARHHQHEVTMDMLDRMERGFPGGHRLDKSTVIGICIFTMVTAIWLFMGYFLQFSLRKLLAYKGLLYESRGPFTFKTKIWVMFVRLLSGRNPLLYSYQKSMPALPVPDLERTVERYLRSVKQLLSEEEYKKMEELATEFKTGIGLKLQRYLMLKSYFSSNYVSDWWERFVYLRSRSQLMINSNYYGVDTLDMPPTTIQTARAANYIYALLSFRKMIDKQKLKPLKHMGIYPLCSAQYERVFNTTRIPGKEEDVLQHLQSSNHIVVYHRGKYYKLTCVFSGKVLKPADLEHQLIKIVNDDETKPFPGEEKLAALTADMRPHWAEVRNKYFSTGDNKASLGMIERAAFVVALDDTDGGIFVKDDPDQMDEFARSNLHGNGYNRWFDKSFTLIVCKNGKVGFNTEHSWADAPVMGQVAEWVMVEDVEKLKYTEDGHCKGEPEFANWPWFMKLRWDINEDCQAIIEKSAEDAKLLIDDVDLHLMIHDEYGKRIMKQIKTSPDAFIQVALQMAFFKDAGHCCLTYEAAMTRLFRDGRTETVRSCTMDTKNFIVAMNDANISREERIRLFRKATDNHVKLYRQAMTGQGIDRHLFCLYVVSKYLEVEVPFLQKVLSEPWRLSTSQTPCGQTGRVDFNKRTDLRLAGGGFGPVDDKGYGVSYIICGDDLLSFHVSCKKSCSSTDAKKFSGYIRKSMQEIKELMLCE
ncbi:carnitine O-palmitoyltransferase 1, liver isoform-like [Rhopilema esculentum]|uniref:carnitine O-palmitoyltransferase 1, liver isoform-like n=1 Tax=Rhopilema esculentum TaxID=499914 RepID=UPI0031D8E28B|eukprot:gene5114-234_t